MKVDCLLLYYFCALMHQSIQRMNQKRLRSRLFEAPKQVLAQKDFTRLVAQRQLLVAMEEAVGVPSPGPDSIGQSPADGGAQAETAADAEEPADPVSTDCVGSIGHGHQGKVQRNEGEAAFEDVWRLKQSAARDQLREDRGKVKTARRQEKARRKAERAAEAERQRAEAEAQRRKQLSEQEALKSSLGLESAQREVQLRDLQEKLDRLNDQKHELVLQLKQVCRTMGCGIQ